MILWHVTERDCVDSIMKNGLVPVYGPLCQLNEDLERVYFFKEIDEDFEHDINNWMVLGHPRNEMVLLKVTLPDNYPGLEERYGWEVMSRYSIPPQFIEVAEYSFVKK